MARAESYQFRAVGLLFAAVWCALFPAVPAQAGNLILKIRAINPSDTETTVEVSGKLPMDIDPKTDIIDLGGMELRYDAKGGVYCVEAKPELKAGENRVYAVVLRDIWTIPQEHIEELKSHAGQLVVELAKTPRSETALDLNEQIDDALTKLAERQNGYSIEFVGVVTHMQAYEQSRKLLNRAGEDIAKLEILAVGEGIVLKKFHGLPPAPPKKEERSAAVGAKPAVIKIKVENPSAMMRTNEIKRYLPAEVRPDDIGIDDARLEARYDAERDACYVYSAGVAVGPTSSVIFDIFVTNRWVIDPQQIESLKVRATNLAARVEGQAGGSMELFGTEAKRISQEIAELSAREAPAALNEDYIADYRNRLESWNGIEASVLRLEELLEPQKQRQIFKSTMLEQVQAPSKSSTWIIIYIILGFLAVVSLLFFLRWYGKGKDEKLAEQK